MNLLLDTHTFIWFLNGNDQLPANLKSLIADTTNRCYLSVASLWEMAIKMSLDKLQLGGDFSQLSGFLVENDIEMLPVTFSHIQQLLRLPFHHRDPFDRMILSQAMAEDLTLVSKDSNFESYAVTLLWK